MTLDEQLKLLRLIENGKCTSCEKKFEQWCKANPKCEVCMICITKAKIVLDEYVKKQ